MHIRHNVIKLKDKHKQTFHKLWCSAGYGYCRFGNSGSTLVSINTVNLRQAQLVLRWVTGPGFNSRCQKRISVYHQPPKSTQPGHPLVGRCNEYQPTTGGKLPLLSIRPAVTFPAEEHHCPLAGTKLCFSVHSLFNFVLFSVVLCDIATNSNCMFCRKHVWSYVT